MYRATPKEWFFEHVDAVDFAVYADFNCPFCYALNERLFALNLEYQADFRLVQHLPEVDSRRVSLELLGELTAEVAEVRRRTPSIEINVPTFRPGTAAALALVYAVSQDDPIAAVWLRRRIYRAFWVEGQDISRADTLAALMLEQDIEPPSSECLSNDELTAWQSEWANNSEFERNLPVIISEHGETVIGAMLEPELDAFLESGSLISDGKASDLRERQVRQRILVLDNDARSLLTIVEQMHDAQVEVAEDFIALIAHARNLGMPDLLMVNTTLVGNISGVDWWRNSTNSDSDPAVPIIHILENRTAESEAAAFKMGASDVIARPFHPKVLRSLLNAHLQRRRVQQKINRFAQIDALTSICNRREFDSRLPEEWGRGARAGCPLAMLMIDVDRLRAFNDSYGHARGDECLVAVARLLGNCMQRPEDLIARYAGGTFVALLPGVDIQGALEVARDIHRAIVDMQIPHPASSVAPHVTVSIGAAALVPTMEINSSLILEQVEIALFQARREKGTPICAF